MGKIDRHNYEAFFLDYLEDNLTPSEEKEFIDFIEANPMLKKELNEWENIKLTPSEKVEFNGKSELKQSVAVFPDETPFEEQCIAKIEGDLEEQEEKLFDQEIKTDINKHKTYKIYEKTRLLPDDTIHYPGKKDLKAKPYKTVTIFRTPLQPILATAASITLIVGLFFNTQTHQTTSYRNYAKTKTINVNSSIDKNKFKEKTANINKNKNYISKDLNIDVNNFLPIAKVENLNTSILSTTTIDRLQPLSITELKTEQNFYTTKPESKKRLIAQKASLDQQNNNTLISLKSSRLNPKLLYTSDKGNRGFSLLDIADLGFNGISKLTGKDIALERTYNKNGDLKKLAFKTESFSISTKIKD